MKQPNFQITNNEIATKFPQIKNGKVHVVAIGEEFDTPRIGKQVPVLFVQETSRLRESNDDFATAALDLNSSRILRKIQNVKVSNLKTLGIKIGSEIGSNYHISVERSFKPSYDNHQRMVRPGTDEVITSGGKDLYEYLTITNGVKDKGLDLKYDTVNTSVSALRG